MIPELFWIFELDLAALEQNRLDAGTSGPCAAVFRGVGSKGSYLQ